jgi:uncharacterized membrane protein YsdA (DUF1294 family)
VWSAAILTQLAELAKKREALAMSTLTVFIVIGVILVGIVGFAAAMFLKRHKTQKAAHSLRFVTESPGRVR